MNIRTPSAQAGFQAAKNAWRVTLAGSTPVVEGSRAGECPLEAS